MADVPLLEQIAVAIVTGLETDVVAGADYTYTPKIVLRVDEIADEDLRDGDQYSHTICVRQGITYEQEQVSLAVYEIAEFFIICAMRYGKADEDPITLKAKNFEHPATIRNAMLADVKKWARNHLALGGLSDNMEAQEDAKMYKDGWVVGVVRLLVKWQQDFDDL